MIKTIKACVLTGLGLQALTTYAASCSGPLDWALRSELSLPVSGIVASVTATPGTRVRAGEELLVLETPPFEARLTAAKADHARSGAELAEQERALARAQELYDRGVLSTVELDHAKLLRTQAQASHRSAEAALKLAQYERDRSRLEAPFDGLVLAVNAAPGQMVAVGLQPPVLVALAKTDAYRIRCRMPATALERARPGDAVRVTVGGAPYSGTLQALALDRWGADAGGEPQLSLEVLLTTEKELPIGALGEVQLP